MSRYLLVGFLSLALSVTLAADDPKPAGPKSAAANAAMSRHERALADAGRAYQQAKGKADQELIADLKAAQGAAMQAKNLGEANALQAVIDQTTAANKAGSAAGGGDLRKRLETAKLITYYRGNKASNIELRPDGNVYENGKRWNVRWNIGTLNGAECILYIDGGTTSRLIQLGDNTYTGFHEGAEIPVAMILK